MKSRIADVSLFMEQVCLRRGEELLLYKLIDLLLQILSWNVFVLTESFNDRT